MLGIIYLWTIKNIYESVSAVCSKQEVINLPLYPHSPLSLSLSLSRLHLAVSPSDASSAHFSFFREQHHSSKCLGLKICHQFKIHQSWLDFGGGEKKSRNLFESVLPPKQQSGTHFKGNVLHAAVLEKILKKQQPQVPRSRGRCCTSQPYLHICQISISFPVKKKGTGCVFKHHIIFMKGVFEI